MATCGINQKLVILLLIIFISCNSYDIPKEPAAITAHTFVGACAQNDIGQVKTLLKQGINVNIRDPKFGRTCLQIAAYEGHYQIVEFVLLQQADVSLQNSHQMTALHYSVFVARNNKPTTYDRRVINLLLKYGADKTINVSDENGTTPLYWACRLHEPEIVKLLLDYGADPNYEDNGRFWAYRCVQRRMEGHEQQQQKAREIWALLRAKGAREPI